MVLPSGLSPFTKLRKCLLSIFAYSGIDLSLQRLNAQVDGIPSGPGSLFTPDALATEFATLATTSDQGGASGGRNGYEWVKQVEKVRGICGALRGRHGVARVANRSRSPPVLSPGLSPAFVNGFRVTLAALEYVVWI